MSITPDILASIYTKPWNMEGGAWKSLCASVRNGFDSMGDRRTGNIAEIGMDGIARIEISGILTARSSFYSGATYSEIIDAVSFADREAAAILFAIDSPGGDAVGNEEAARAISEVSIPTATYSPGMLCSAAYALAVGTNHIVGTPSALVGSVGTIIAYVDESGLWDAVGIKPDYIVSGDLKGSGMPPSLSDAHRASLQEIVDDLFAQFKGHVLNNREVDDTHMRGQAMVATRGVTANLIDAVGDENDAVEYLLKNLR
jgi:protease-4